MAWLTCTVVPRVVGSEGSRLGSRRTVPVKLAAPVRVFTPLALRPTPRECRTSGSRAAARRCHRMQGGSVPGASGVRSRSPACAAAAVAPASRFASASRAATETTAKQRRSCKPEHTASAGDGAFARARSWGAASAASRAVRWMACSCGQRTRAPQHPTTVGCRRRSGGHRPGSLGAGCRAPHGASA